MKPGFVYIMASRLNGTLYLGVTSNLVQRAYQHRNGLIEGFSREHGCVVLVWFECHDDLQDARRRELQIKKWKRDWKIQLIERGNPDWLDLYPALFGQRNWAPASAGALQAPLIDFATRSDRLLPFPSITRRA